MDSVSDNGLTVTYKAEGVYLEHEHPERTGHAAKLDGTEAPYKGDPGTTSVSVKKVEKNTIEETDKRDGKVISVLRLTVAADGKSMTFAVDATACTTSRNPESKTGRGGRDRTADPLLPKQVRYHCATPRPVGF